MKKFSFRIRTRSGLPVDNLVIHAPDQAEAERKLRQMYMHCTIVEVKTIEQNLARGESADLEDIISLIANRDSEQK